MIWKSDIALIWGRVQKLSSLRYVTEFIRHDLQVALLSQLSKCKFFSVQAHVTTDAGNVEVELYLALHFDPLSSDGKVHVRSTFFFLPVQMVGNEVSQLVLDTQLLKLSVNDFKLLWKLLH